MIKNVQKRSRSIYAKTGEILKRTSVKVFYNISLLSAKEFDKII